MSALSAMVAPSKVQDRRIAYLLLRLALGSSLFGHGLVRLPKLGEFHGGTLEQFAHSYLPAALVSLAGYGIPVAELVLGSTITLGVLTRVSLIGAALEVITLIYGSTTIENWSAIGDQLLHVIPLTALLALAEFNVYSIDYVILRRRGADPRADGRRRG